jgi:serine protease inhibitor
MNTKTVTIINTVEIYVTLYTTSFMNNREGVNPFEIVEENSMKFLAVENRKGTEAAAVTAIGMGLTSVGSSNRRVRLNKPF